MIKSAEAQADSIRAGGQASGQASMVSGIAGGIGGLGGLFKGAGEVVRECRNAYSYG